MPALGERFTAAREARGLSIAEVADQIRIRSIYLQAIEDSNWSAIGAPVYVRGFLRTYARFLGLDAEAAIAEYNAAAAQRSESGAATGWAVDSQVPLRRRPQLSALIWIGSIVAVGLVAIVVYNEITLSGSRVPIPAATGTSLAAATPTATASATQAAQSGAGQPSARPLVPGEHAVTVQLVGLCWIRVTVDGSVQLQGTYGAGTRRTFYGKRITLRLGNAAAARLTVDDKDFGTMGGPGEVIERSITS